MVLTDLRILLGQPATQCIVDSFKLRGLAVNFVFKTATSDGSDVEVQGPATQKGLESSVTGGKEQESNLPC